MQSLLEAFLSRNSVAAAEGLPLIHTTRSSNVRSIMDCGIIEPQKCDVFTEDNLNYFFVGRPAYKYDSDSSQTPHWELPSCFIFESESISSVKRIFPFDSGAFSQKRYPSYITTMPISNFEVKSPDSPKKIIGAFFGSSKRYLDLKPKSIDDFESEYSIGPLEHELSAAARLAGKKTPKNFDDRRFTIEVQSEEAVHLADNNPLAVILPEVYLDDESVLNKIQGEWLAEPIGYPIFPLSLSMYYSWIYKEVSEFYKRRGIV